VLEADFSENGGVQFDRTASLYLANANLYFGTTPEPLATLTNTWHVEREVTDYSALLATPQQGTIVLANCTTDCAPPFNSLNGVFTVNASLEFYPAARGHRDDRDDRDERPPDAVLPLVQTSGNGGVNLPATLSSPTDQLSTTFTLPTNCRVGRRNFTSSRSQIRDVMLSHHPARAVPERPAPFVQV
jgi:hypothetical protein